MAKKQPSSKRDRFFMAKMLANGTALLSCLVLMIGGVMVHARTSRTIYWCIAATFLINFGFAVVIGVMKRYEEIHGGKG